MIDVNLSYTKRITIYEAEELLNNKWSYQRNSNTQEDIYCQNGAEQGNLSALAWEVKWKWENQVDEAELKLGWDFI